MMIDGAHMEMPCMFCFTFYTCENFVPFEVDRVYEKILLKNPCH